MSNYSQLYWLTRLDNIQSFFGTLLTICLFGIVVYFIAQLFSSMEMEQGEFTKRYKWVLKTFIASSIISGLLLVFIPTKNDLIFIYAGGKAMDYVEADTSLQKIPFQTTKIISNYLDSKLKEAETQLNTESK